MNITDKKPIDGLQRQVNFFIDGFCYIDLNKA